MVITQQHFGPVNKYMNINGDCHKKKIFPPILWSQGRDTASANNWIFYWVLIIEQIGHCHLSEAWPMRKDCQQ